jgi:hypothetical protein
VRMATTTLISSSYSAGSFGSSALNSTENAGTTFEPSSSHWAGSNEHSTSPQQSTQGSAIRYTGYDASQDSQQSLEGSDAESNNDGRYPAFALTLQAPSNTQARADGFSLTPYNSTAISLHSVQSTYLPSQTSLTGRRRSSFGRRLQGIADTFTEELKTRREEDAIARQHYLHHSRRCDERLRHKLELRDLTSRSGLLGSKPPLTEETESRIREIEDAIDSLDVTSYHEHMAEMAKRREARKSEWQSSILSNLTPSVMSYRRGD